MIKVKEKEEMWSWGVLERNGKEGWCVIHKILECVRKRKFLLSKVEALNLPYDK